ncbi:PAS domain-containing protein [Microvirga sp. Mcv34]|uniref:PAS domain-containing protein n=1 Tax=Microvirga sp. Mcv34 TaxID=2926016 RepID=UPI0021C66A41|nr:PAS domain-containing protein [Microvirga sp. Mcv34]
METNPAAFSMPATLEPELARLRIYWKDLLRGENAMPFSDDIDLSQIPELASRVLLLQAFESPVRFRFEHAGEHVISQYGTPLEGMFSDEVRQQGPLQELTRQCSATLARRAPTYFRSAVEENQAAYARLLLPTWGEGHIMLLLGAVVDSPEAARVQA